MSKKLDLTGQTFRRLIVLRPAPDKVSKSGAKQTQWLCVCECGRQTEVQTRHLRSGQVSSCGCGHPATKNPMFRNFGGSAKSIHHPLYHTYLSMLHRCLNPRDAAYSGYGARGITVCSLWQESFFAFAEYMGPKPYDDASLDRIDNDGNYEPGNCRWASKKEQANNRRIPLGPLQQQILAFLETRGWTRVCEIRPKTRSYDLQQLLNRGLLEWRPHNGRGGMYRFKQTHPSKENEASGDTAIC